MFSESTGFVFELHCLWKKNVYKHNSMSRGCLFLITCVNLKREFVWKNTQYHHSKNKQNVGLNKLSVCDSLFLFQYVFKHVFIIVIYLYNIIKLFSETKRLLMNIWTHLFGKSKGFFECWSLAFVRLCYVVIRCNFIDYISFIV